MYFSPFLLVQLQTFKVIAKVRMLMVLARMKVPAATARGARKETKTTTSCRTSVKQRSYTRMIDPLDEKLLKIIGSAPQNTEVKHHDKEMFSLSLAGSLRKLNLQKRNVPFATNNIKYPIL